eukprot:s1285_g28.t1
MAVLPLHLDESIRSALEDWAIRQPESELRDALCDVEQIFESLNLAELYESLLATCSAQVRKNLTYVGGIRTCSKDIGAPAPYSSTTAYICDDGGRQSVRDPGNAVWAEIFSLLPGVSARPGLQGLSDETKGDFLELTLGAAAVVLDGSGEGGSSQALQRCLHAARLLLEDLANHRGDPCAHQSRDICLGTQRGWRDGPPERMRALRRHRLWTMVLCHLDRSHGRCI